MPEVEPLTLFPYEIRALLTIPAALQLIIDYHHAQEAMADAIGEPETDACASVHVARRKALEAVRDAIQRERDEKVGDMLVIDGYEQDATPPVVTPFDYKRANELGDAIVQRICDSPDHTSPDDDPQLLCMYPSELHTAVVAELENEFERVTGRSCLEQPAAETPATLCPHGMPLAENTCGPCSQGKPNRPRVEPPAPLLGLLRDAYLTVLREPIGVWRITHQPLYCQLRDAIAEIQGRDPESVQNQFEDDARRPVETEGSQS